MKLYIISLSVLIAAVILIRATVKRSVPKRLVYALWLAVAIRLIIPFSPIKVDFPASSPAYEKISSATVFEGGKSVSDEVPVPENGNGSESANVAENEVLSAGGSDIRHTESRVRKHISPKKIIFAVYICGASLSAAVFAFSALRMTVRLMNGRKFVRIYRGVRVYRTRGASSPCTLGLFPVIYLPAKELTESEEELALLHEITHLRHGDNFWSVIRIFAMILNWYNPLVLAAALLSKRDGELACDEAVTKRMDYGTRLEYARLIVNSIPEKQSLASELGAEPIKERIIMLTKKQKNHIFLAVAAIILALAATGCSLVGKKSENTEKTENYTIECHSAEIARKSGVIKMTFDYTLDVGIPTGMKKSEKDGIVSFSDGSGNGIELLGLVLTDSYAAFSGDLKANAGDYDFTSPFVGKAGDADFVGYKNADGSKYLCYIKIDDNFSYKLAFTGGSDKNDNNAAAVLNTVNITFGGSSYDSVETAPSEIYVLYESLKMASSGKAVCTAELADGTLMATEYSYSVESSHGMKMSIKIGVPGSGFSWEYRGDYQMSVYGNYRATLMGKWGNPEFAAMFSPDNSDSEINSDGKRIAIKASEGASTEDCAIIKAICFTEEDFTALKNR